LRKTRRLYHLGIFGVGLESAEGCAVVVIIGGGFSGTSAAIHLLRKRGELLEIVLVEPAARLGGGLAHSSADPDHRLNAPASVHVVLPEEAPEHLEAWLRAQGCIDRDPESLCNGSLYPRRSDFGDYVRAQLDHAIAESTSTSRHPQAHAIAQSGSRFRHLRTRATAIARVDGRFRVTLESGTCVDADACIVATGHERPRPPEFVSPDVAVNPRYLDDPWNLSALDTLDRRSNVLLIGTALTAVDAVATLLRRGHMGAITALSRHGYRPAGQNPSPSSRSLWEAINEPLPDFVARHGTPARVREILRILRTNIAEQEREGRTWHAAFDEVRNAARQLWGALPEREKQRFLRHARAFYDPHRFRLPPQTGRILDDALSSGRLTLRAGRIRSVSAMGDGFEVEYRPRHATRTVRERFGAIVSCTGPEISVRRSPNPLIRSLLHARLACEDAAGIGLATAPDCQVLDPQRTPVRGLYSIGPLTRGLMGETPAVPLITWQVRTLIPKLLADLRTPEGA
jgi:uncharacterized NAD(P)/FAD-binding protein YdhS